MKNRWIKFSFILLLLTSLKIYAEEGGSSGSGGDARLISVLLENPYASWVEFANGITTDQSLIRELFFKEDIPEALFELNYQNELLPQNHAFNDRALIFHDGTWGLLFYDNLYDNQFSEDYFESTLFVFPKAYSFWADNDRSLPFIWQQDLPAQLAYKEFSEDASRVSINQFLSYLYDQESIDQLIELYETSEDHHIFKVIIDGNLYFMDHSEAVDFEP